MRVRNRTGSLSKASLDESQAFMLRRVLLYMDRLLARFPNLDYEVLEALHWLLGPEIVEEDLLSLALMLDTGERKRRFEGEIEEEIRYGRDFAHLLDQALRRTSKNDQKCVVGLLRGLLNKRLDQLKYDGVSYIEKNLDTLQQMFDLN